MPPPGLGVVAPVIVCPACDAVNGAAVEQIAGLDERLLRHVVLSDQANDRVPLVPPSQNWPAIRYSVIQEEEPP